MIVGTCGSILPPCSRSDHPLVNPPQLRAEGGVALPAPDGRAVEVQLAGDVGRGSAARQQACGGELAGVEAVVSRNWVRSHVARFGCVALRAVAPGCMGLHAERVAIGDARRTDSIACDTARRAQGAGEGSAEKIGFVSSNRVAGCVRLPEVAPGCTVLHGRAGVTGRGSDPGGIGDSPRQAWNMEDVSDAILTNCEQFFKPFLARPDVSEPAESS